MTTTTSTTTSWSRSGTAALLALVVSAALSWAPFIGILASPFRMLSTTIHELGHGLGALLTGGDFLNYVVRSDGSGHAVTAGGWRLVVIPAGYLGVAVFAAILLRLGRREKTARRALAVVGAIMVLLSLRFALPSIWRDEAVSGALALVSGLAIGGGLLWSGLKASALVASFTLYLVAFQSALSAFSDLRTLIGLSSRANVHTDAHAMAELLWLPPIFWAVVWAVLALGILWIGISGRLGPPSKASST